SPDWCYTESSCAPNTWTSLGSCNASNESPIDILENYAQYNASLGPFQFTNYTDPSKLLTITNNGHTVEIEVGDGVSLSAGGLSSVYMATAFHFHWGNGTPGSEHWLSGKQYPMEMHIVHTKNGMNLTEAKKDAAGIAVLGFFIDTKDSANTSKMLSLSKLLQQVSVPGKPLPLNSTISLDELLADVNRSMYYRYMGSLTTPTCDQAVVWTVFKNPIFVPSWVVKAFTTTLKYNVSNATEPLVNNFRPLQPLHGRQVQASFTMQPSVNSTAASTVTPASSVPSSGSIIWSTNILYVSLFLVYQEMANNVI
ncbi:carbonic anhydrase 4-like, partial [Pyxicephalus adspersus]|uniref:carbonic anhydrase 4-like n=1 Tax=Pyxicephalus adspersus TaxID=30357 RepID=UPI003B5C4972